MKTPRAPRAPRKRRHVSARSKEVARMLRAISKGAYDRLPAWSVVDVFTCKLLAEAADLIAPNPNHETPKTKSHTARRDTAP